jgi:hypothetical protein
MACPSEVFYFITCLSFPIWWILYPQCGSCVWKLQMLQSKCFCIVTNTPQHASNKQIHKTLGLCFPPYFTVCSKLISNWQQSIVAQIRTLLNKVNSSRARSKMDDAAAMVLEEWQAPSFGDLTDCSLCMVGKVQCPCAMRLHHTAVWKSVQKWPWRKTYITWYYHCSAVFWEQTRHVETHGNF